MRSKRSWGTPLRHDPKMTTKDPESFSGNVKESMERYDAFHFKEMIL